MKSLWGKALFLWAAVLMVAAFAGCSTPTGDEIGDDDYTPNSGTNRPKSSSSVVQSSSSVQESSDSSSEEGGDAFANLDSLVRFVQIPASKLNRSTVVFSVDAFEISQTEVTQELYELVMGVLPEMRQVGNKIAVANVNWYDAVLFCNALSKYVGLDTAYIYEEMGDSRYLKNLTIDYDTKAVRLPTETEWEIACRAGTTTTYYWNTASASKYAYYVQKNGPAEVGQFLPNDYNLYDMGGNVAEWTNDWYDSYPVRSTENYRGPETGKYRVVRGGGWSQTASSMASAERDKRDPLFESEIVGFRISVNR